MRYYSDPTLTISQANNMTPDVTWTFQSDEYGYVEYSDSNKYFIKVQDPNHILGNKKVFKDQDGISSIPIGTVVIKEVKAPNGWQLNDEEKIIHYTWDSALNTVIADVDEFWNTDNKLNDLSLDSKEVPSEPDVGSLQIAKWDKDLGDGYTKQGGGRIGSNGTAGTKFALINRTGGSIEYTKNGTKYTIKNMQTKKALEKSSRVLFLLFVQKRFRSHQNILIILMTDCIQRFFIWE